jgi:hypothetical protein
MDPLTIGAAYVIARTTVNGIKEAIKLGKDAGEIAGEISKFFHSASTVEKAAKKIDADRVEKLKDDVKKGQPKGYYELTAEAMDIAIKAEEIKRFEEEIKNALIWSGRGHIYHTMISERNRMQNEQARALALEELEKSRIEKEKQHQKELMKDIMWCVIAFAMTGGFIWWVIDFMIAKGMGVK